MRSFQIIKAKRQALMLFSTNQASRPVRTEARKILKIPPFIGFPSRSILIHKCRGLFNMEILLSSPYCWKSHKICDFIKTAHNCVKDKPTDDKFKITIDLEATSQTNNVWYPENTWKALLGEKHYSILTTFSLLDKKTNKVIKRATKNVKDDSVLDLLAKIRNKFEHNAILDDDEKEATKWFSKVDGQWEFDEHLYATFWVCKFPKVLPFLWEKFQEFRHCPTMESFYPTNINAKCISIVDFVIMLQEGYQANLEKGHLDARFGTSPPQKEIKLEFRILEEAVLCRLLNGSTIAEVEVAENTVIVKWYDKLADKITQNVYTNSIGNCWGTVYHGRILFTNRISNLDDSIIFTGLSNTDIAAKVVIFTITNCHIEMKALCTKIEKTCKVNLVEMPVQWDELSKCVQTEVESKSMAIIQDKKLCLEGILPQNEESRKNIMSNLSGHILNDLLRKHSSTLLAKHKVPSKLEIYLERLIYKRIEITSDIFKNCGSDVFLITNITFAETKGKDFYTDDVEEVNKFIKVDDETDQNDYRSLDSDSDDDIYFDSQSDGDPLDTSLNEQAISNDDNSQCVDENTEEAPTSPKPVYAHPLKHKVNLVKEDMYDREMDFRPIFKGQSERPTFHALKYLHKNLFEWISTDGSTTTLEQTYEDFLTACKMYKENEFLEYIDRRYGEERLILIADKPGMGKSQALLSLATKLQKRLDRVVLFVNANEFLKLVKNSKTENEKLDLNNIIRTLISLCCSNEFEKHLVNFWLNEKDACKIKFELMIDGLDEANRDCIDQAFDILKIIKNGLPSVRVWVAARDHMINEIRDKLNGYTYKLKRFSEEEQINFLEQYWLQVWADSENHSDNKPCSEELRNFAKKCISVPLSREKTEITGIPLQCRLIGEIYKSKVLSGDFELDPSTNYSFTQMYETMIEQKFQVYLKEKKQLNLEMNDTLVNTLRKDMENSHVYYALKLIFVNEHDSEVASLFKDYLLTDANDENPNHVLEPGIIQNLDPLVFIHRTFAEFLVARFVYNIFTGKPSKISKKSKLFVEFSQKIVFNGEWRSRDTFFNEDNSCWFHYPVMIYFLNALLDTEKCDVLNTFYDLLKASVNVKNALCKTYLPLVAANDAGFKNVYRIIVENREGMTELLKFVCCAQDLKLCKFLFQNESVFGNRLWDELPSIDDKGFGLIHWIVSSFYPKLILFPWDSLETHKNELKDLLKLVVQRDQSMIELKDAKGRSPLLLLLGRGWYFYNEYNFVHDDFSVSSNLEEESEEPDDSECLVESYVELVYFFVQELKADVNATDSNGNTVLHIADESEIMFLEYDSDGPDREYYELSYHIPLLEFLLENGCNGSIINSVNKFGHTPLLNIMHFLGKEVQKGKLLLKLFSKYGADFNIKDAEGNTVLHNSITSGYNADFVKELVECGADIYTVNGKGQSALQLAEERGDIDIIKMLVEDYDASLNSRGVVNDAVLQSTDKQESFSQYENMAVVLSVLTDVVEKVAEDIESI